MIVLFGLNTMQRAFEPLAWASSTEAPDHVATGARCPHWHCLFPKPLIIKHQTQPQRDGSRLWLGRSSQIMADSPSPAPQPPQPPAPTTHTGSPTDFLKGVVGKRVVVRLLSGVDYRGILSCLDGYMNIAMEQTEESVNGKVVNRYGDAFIRGNNVLYISADEPI
ncbi:small nuclear riboprotein F [Coprinopsis cinerea AmutBmut pab1-1]|nr:small nuclear riboprotein F [Coprinopsis cinerea AmutBmut pab1-1]